MPAHDNVGWLCDRLKALHAIEPKDLTELLDWLEARRSDVPFSAELIPLRDVADLATGRQRQYLLHDRSVLCIEGVRVRSAPGVREIAGWDQPEGSRFWRKSNENMILFVEDAVRLTINDQIYRWASLSQIQQMLLDSVIGPYVRTVVALL